VAVHTRRRVSHRAGSAGGNRFRRRARDRPAPRRIHTSSLLYGPHPTGSDVAGRATLNALMIAHDVQPVDEVDNPMLFTTNAASLISVGEGFDAIVASCNALLAFRAGEKTDQQYAQSDSPIGTPSGRLARIKSRVVAQWSAAILMKWNRQHRHQRCLVRKRHRSTTRAPEVNGTSGRCSLSLVHRAPQPQAGIETREAARRA